MIFKNKSMFDMRYDSFDASSYRDALLALGVRKVVTKAKAAKLKDAKSDRSDASSVSADKKELNREAARQRYIRRKKLRSENRLHESPEKVRDFAKPQNSEPIQDLEF